MAENGLSLKKLVFLHILRSVKALSMRKLVANQTGLLYILNTHRGKAKSKK